MLPLSQRRPVAFGLSNLGSCSFLFAPCSNLGKIRNSCLVACCPPSLSPPLSPASRPLPPQRPLKKDSWPKVGEGRGQRRRSRRGRRSGRGRGRRGTEMRHRGDKISATSTRAIVRQGGREGGPEWRGLMENQSSLFLFFLPLSRRLLLFFLTHSLSSSFLMPLSHWCCFSRQRAPRRHR